jgi:hypothetical protein
MRGRRRPPEKNGFYERNAMRYGKVIVPAACGALVLSGSLFVSGCNKKNTPAEQTQDTAQSAAENAKDTAKSAASNLKDQADNAKDTGANAADAMSKSQIAKNAAAQLNQVKQYIDDKKYDLADKALSRLEAEKSSLPESVQVQLPTVRKSLDAAKKTAAGGM